MLPFASTLANAVAIGALVVSLAGGAWALKVHYDNGIIAQVAAKQATAAAAAQAADDARTIAGLQAAATAATARLARLTQLEAMINATPKTIACQATPAFRALVLGLRHGSSGAGYAKGTASPGMAVPATAATAR